MIYKKVILVSFFMLLFVYCYCWSYSYESFWYFNSSYRVVLVVFCRIDCTLWIGYFFYDVLAIGSDCFFCWSLTSLIMANSPLRNSYISYSCTSLGLVKNNSFSLHAVICSINFFSTVGLILIISFEINSFLNLFV